jgi:hypothetical protein
MLLCPRRSILKDTTRMKKMKQIQARRCDADELEGTGTETVDVCAGPSTLLADWTELRVKYNHMNIAII